MSLLKIQKLRAKIKALFLLTSPDGRTGSFTSMELHEYHKIQSTLDAQRRAIEVKLLKLESK